MGQNLSSEADAVQKKSHYDLLEVPAAASEEEIKKAYRKKALELHPDRNYGKEDNATDLFAEIQTAYSVLSDPQERAWYDAHQAEFLSGGAGDVQDERSVTVTTAEDIRGMCASRSSAFRDFTDSPNGFFTKVRELFKKLAMEESIAAANGAWEPIDFPSFGSSKDEFQDVVKSFYSGWGGFSTAKTYAWKDLYRPSADHDRRTRRAMEKENQKTRDDAIREFNDAVRALVLFVRRRDPRYIPTATTDAERQNTLKEAAAAQAARARKANAEKLASQAMPSWTQSRDDQEGDDYATDEGGDGDEEDQVEEEEEDEEPEIWECVGCSKTFKSEGQYDAHERSKKHKQAVFRLKREMREEDAELGLKSKMDGTQETIIGETKNKDTADELSEELEEKLDLDNIEPQRPSVSNDNENIEHETTKPASGNTSEEASDSEDMDDSYAPRSKIKPHILNDPAHPVDTNTGTSTLHPHNQDEEAVSEASGASKPASKLGKAKEKRAKRAAKAVASAAAATHQSALDDRESGGLECVACQEVFVSKNKLFDHIKRTGHARPVVDGGIRIGKGRKGR